MWCFFHAASDASDSMPRNVSYNSDMADQAAPSSPTSTDGWGELENGTVEHESDKDGWDDIEPVDQKPPPALANIYAAQKRPVVPPKQQVTSSGLGSSVTAAAKEEDDLWGAVAAPALKTTAKPIQPKTVTSDDDDPWGSIAAAPPKTTAKPLQPKSTASSDDDPWAAIAAPAPTTRAKPLSAARGRGSRAAPMKLGVQRINRSSSSDT
ncbi:hypothetical protein EJ110_NYTH52411 [Nymphaea thermarum]|nr:hypothetical protein EJ110_NYTH52411 [Nymphaea thermarum]